MSKGKILKIAYREGRKAAQQTVKASGNVLVWELQPQKFEIINYTLGNGNFPVLNAFKTRLKNSNADELSLIVGIDELSNFDSEFDSFVDDWADDKNADISDVTISDLFDYDKASLVDFIYAYITSETPNAQILKECGYFDYLVNIGGTPIQLAKLENQGMAERKPQLEKTAMLAGSIPVMAANVALDKGKSFPNGSVVAFSQCADNEQLTIVNAVYVV